MPQDRDEDRSHVLSALPRDTRELIQVFDRHQVDFVVVGGWAVALHGYSRSTKDFDIFIRPAADNAVRVLQALREFGAPTSMLSIEELESPGLIYQIGMAPFRVDIINVIEGVTFDEAASKPLIASVAGVTIRVIGKAALIKNKRAAARPQDLVDANALDDSKPDPSGAEPRPPREPVDARETSTRTPRKTK